MLALYARRENKPCSHMHVIATITSVPMSRISSMSFNYYRHETWWPQFRHGSSLHSVVPHSVVPHNEDQDSRQDAGCPGSNAEDRDSMQVKGESIQDQEATVEGVEPSCDEVAELGACGVRPEGAHRLRFICMRQQNLRHQRNCPKMELFEPGP